MTDSSFGGQMSGSQWTCHVYSDNLVNMLEVKTIVCCQYDKDVIMGKYGEKGF